MVFSSITFLFFLLPLFLLAFHAVKRTQFILLLLSSLLFYFWGDNIIIWVLLLTTLIDYLCGLLISDGFKKTGPVKLIEGAKRTRLQKFGLVFSIVSNLSLLLYFKYANFFIDNVKVLISKLGIVSPIFENMPEIVLPLGISFYTFQAMSYTIDVYMGKIKANRSFVQFAGYVAMFPQLVAGPIVRYSDIEAEMNNHKVTVDGFVYGIKRFIIGLAKKVIVANTMASVADKIFALPESELSTALAWLGIIAYTLQIFFDFSGYSCMAIGLGKMIGFSFPENFNYPYISRSIQEFWRRWHISLSTWFRDYLYIPLGGSRKGNFITYRNLILVFFLCGLWHGAEWTFVIWGLFHGFFLVLERTRFKNLLDKLPNILRSGYTILVVMIGWVFFRAESFHQAIKYIGVLFGQTHAATQWSAIKGQLPVNAAIILVAGLLLSTPIFFTVKSFVRKFIKSTTVIELVFLAVLIVLFVLSAMLLATGTYNPFIYFRF